MHATIKYNTEITKWFSVMACIYLVIGTAIGVYIASELAWPFLNFDNPYISFGRLRPVHTNTVVYGFAGSEPVKSGYGVTNSLGLHSGDGIFML